MDLGMSDNISRWLALLLMRGEPRSCWGGLADDLYWCSGIDQRFSGLEKRSAAWSSSRSESVRTILLRGELLIDDGICPCDWFPLWNWCQLLLKILTDGMFSPSGRGRRCRQCCRPWGRRPPPRKCLHISLLISQMLDWWTSIWIINPILEIYSAR